MGTFNGIDYSNRFSQKVEDWIWCLLTKRRWMTDCCPHFTILWGLKFLWSFSSPDCSYFWYRIGFLQYRMGAEIHRWESTRIPRFRDSFQTYPHHHHGQSSTSGNFISQWWIVCPQWILLFIAQQTLLELFIGRCSLDHNRRRIGGTTNKSFSGFGIHHHTLLSPLTALSQQVIHSSTSERPSRFTLVFRWDIKN